MNYTHVMCFGFFENLSILDWNMLKRHVKLLDIGPVNHLQTFENSNELSFFTSRVIAHWRIFIVF